MRSMQQKFERVRQRFASLLISFFSKGLVFPPETRSFYDFVSQYLSYRKQGFQVNAYAN